MGRVWLPAEATDMVLAGAPGQGKGRWLGWQQRVKHQADPLHSFRT